MRQCNQAAVWLFSLACLFRQAALASSCSCRKGGGTVAPRRVSRALQGHRAMCRVEAEAWIMPCPPLPLGTSQLTPVHRTQQDGKTSIPTCPRGSCTLHGDYLGGHQFDQRPGYAPQSVQTPRVLLLLPAFFIRLDQRIRTRCLWRTHCVIAAVLSCSTHGVEPTGCGPTAWPQHPLTWLADCMRHAGC